MKTTSIELSKKLYEAFGWSNTLVFYFASSRLSINGEKLPDSLAANGTYHFGMDENDIPAYDTDFLLDKLPKFVGDDKVPHLLCLQPNPVGKGWMAFYRHKSISPSHRLVETSHVAEADIPSEALGNLALALKEKGLL